MIKGLLWDSDGVVVDSETPARDQGLVDIVASLGGTLDIKKVKPLLTGKPIQECMSIVVKECGLSCTPDVLYAERISALKAFYGQVDYTFHFKDFCRNLERSLEARSALASGCDTELFNTADRRLKLRTFFNGHVYLSHELTSLQSKPKPDIFIHAARELGIEPTDCLVFEDAPMGVVAGWAAGTSVVGFTKTFGESLYDKAVAAARKAKTPSGRFIAIPDFLDESYMRVYRFARSL